MRLRVRELEERERKESKKLADEDALRKIRVAEETIEHLQKKLAATKQVCVFSLNTSERVRGDRRAFCFFLYFSFYLTLKETKREKDG